LGSLLAQLGRTYSVNKICSFCSPHLPILLSTCSTNCQIFNFHLLRRFLWEGGKTDKKKFHLIKWDIVKQPKENGGLGIKDPALTNLAMGEKILWNLVSGRNDWWKQVLKKNI
jgi:hypothetical protein